MNRHNFKRQKSLILSKNFNSYFQSNDFKFLWSRIIFSKFLAQLRLIKVRSIQKFVVFDNSRKKTWYINPWVIDNTQLMQLGDNLVDNKKIYWTLFTFRPAIEAPFTIRKFYNLGDSQSLKIKTTCRKFRETYKRDLQIAFHCIPGCLLNWFNTCKKGAGTFDLALIKVLKYLERECTVEKF